MATRRHRRLRRNDGSPLAEAETTLEVVKASLRAPVVSAQVSTLGGKHRPSVMLTVSLDPRETWVNGILQNSRYANFRIDFPDRVIEGFNRSPRSLPNFRKTRFKTPEEALLKLQRWVDSAPLAANSRHNIEQASEVMSWLLWQLRSVTGKKREEVLKHVQRMLHYSEGKERTALRSLVRQAGLAANGRRKPTLSRITEETYGVNALRAEPIVLEWAFDRLSRQVGLPEARAQLRAINERREALGRSGGYPHRLMFNGRRRTSRRAKRRTSRSRR